MSWGRAESPWGNGESRPNPPPHQGSCTSRASPPLSSSDGSDLPGDMGWAGTLCHGLGTVPQHRVSTEGNYISYRQIWLHQSKAPVSGRLWGHRVPQNDLALLQGGSWFGREDRWPGHRAWGLPCAERGHHVQGEQALGKLWHTEHHFVLLTHEILFKGSLGRAVPLVGQGRPRGHVQILARGLLCHGFIFIAEARRYGHHNWD